jgi:signal transduction histidine kinase
MDAPGGPAVAGRPIRARVASLGLAGVVICLAAFTIVAAYTTRAQVDRAQLLQALRDTYQSVTSAVGEEENAELAFIVDPSNDHSIALSAANGVTIAKINELTAHGGSDAQLARDMLALHGRLLVSAAREAAAIFDNNQAQARQIHDEQSVPMFFEMEVRLTTATDQGEAEASAAFASLRDTSQWMLTLAPVVFTIGFVLLLGLWRILEGYQQATSRTYKQIEQLSRLRAEFVSTVSHEFRTPLTGIQGFSEMMRDEELSVAQMREFAGDINKDALRLARLIADMLDLDRMESGRMTFNLEPLDLNRILADAAAPFRLSAADHPIELHLDESLPTIVGSSDRLTQVVTNLVSNAIKYSPSGGAVELRTERDEKMAVLTIRDHGMGIPTEMLETIFDRYSRIESKVTATIQGTGLGLPIVRQIVQLHAGKVWATSEPGQGSTFHVRLPLGVPAVGEHAAALPSAVA